MTCIEEPSKQTIDIVHIGGERERNIDQSHADTFLNNWPNVSNHTIYMLLLTIHRKDCAIPQ